MLLAVDFRGSWQRAFGYALGIARAAGARLFELHALEDVARPSEGAELPRAIAERLRAELPAGPVSAGGHEEIVAAGPAQRLIPRLATERRADLVVLGFEPQHLVAESLSGSTLWHVLRGMSCPVLAVPLA